MVKKGGCALCSMRPSRWLGNSRCVRFPIQEGRKGQGWLAAGHLPSPRARLSLACLLIPPDARRPCHREHVAREFSHRRRPGVLSRRRLKVVADTGSVRWREALQGRGAAKPFRPCCRSNCESWEQQKPTGRPTHADNATAQGRRRPADSSALIIKTSSQLSFAPHLHSSPLPFSRHHSLGASRRPPTAPSPGHCISPHLLRS